MSFLADCNFGTEHTGKTVQYQLFNADKTVDTAWTNTGVTELIASSGVYGVELADSKLGLTIAWRDDATSPTIYATEILGAVKVFVLGADVLGASNIADDAFSAEHFAADWLEAAGIKTGAFTADAYAADAFVAATFATDSITSDALAASAVNEIVDQTWDEDRTDHESADSMGWVMQLVKSFIYNKRVDTATQSIIYKDDSTTALVTQALTDGSGTATRGKST